MLIRTMKAILAVGIASASGGACAMSQSTDEVPACRVIGGEKLSAEIGGADGLCAAVEKAIREKAPAARYSIELRVVSDHTLAASITLGDGRELPERKMSISDRQFNRGAIDRFAESIASEIALSASR